MQRRRALGSRSYLLTATFVIAPSSNSSPCPLVAGIHGSAAAIKDCSPRMNRRPVLNRSGTLGLPLARGIVHTDPQTPGDEAVVLERRILDAVRERDAFPSDMREGSNPIGCSRSRVPMIRNRLRSERLSAFLRVDLRRAHDDAARAGSGRGVGDDVGSADQGAEAEDVREHGRHALRRRRRRREEAHRAAVLPRRTSACRCTNKPGHLAAATTRLDLLRPRRGVTNDVGCVRRWTSDRCPY